MKQVLLLTVAADPIADYLEKSGIPEILCFRLNVDEYEQYSICINEQGWTLNRGTVCLSNEMVDGVYFMDSLGSAVAESLLTFVKGRLLADPATLQFGRNRIIQSRTAQEAGFIIPKYLITNDHHVADHFCQQATRIVKPSENLSVEAALQYENLEKCVRDQDAFIRAFAQIPLHFREEMDWQYGVKVIVAWEECFAVREYSGNPYRWNEEGGTCSMMEMDIPKEIKEHCVGLMKKLHLCLATITLGIYEDVYYFLELNTRENWVWMDCQFHWNIREKILRQLVAED